jgi:hypothetical protein
VMSGNVNWIGLEGGRISGGIGMLVISVPEGSVSRTRMRVFGSKKDCWLPGVPGDVGAVEKVFENCEEYELGGEREYADIGEPSDTHDAEAL